MKNSSKASLAAGIGLIILAALFSISLLLVLFDFGRANPVAETFLFRAGKMLTGVYGLCSALIPLFLIVAASQCFTENWGIKRGVLLLGSVIPFFTLDALEHIARIIIANNADAVLGIKLSTALLIGLVIVAIEYALLAMLGDTLQNMLGSPSEQEDDDDEIEDIAEDDRVMFSEEAEEAEDADDSDDDEEVHAVPLAAPLAKKEYDENEEVELKDGEYIESEEIYDEDSLPPEDEVEAEDSEPTEKDISKLNSGEDNPFMHVFDEADEEPAQELTEDVADEETAVEDAIDQDMTVEEALAQSENDIPEAEDKSDESESFPEPVPYIPENRGPAPEYNEDAFFPEPEEEATELLELDSFNPEEDSYRDMVVPPDESVDDVEPLDEEVPPEDEESDEDIMSAFGDNFDEEADTSFEPDEYDLMAQSAEAHRLADQLEAEADDENFADDELLEDNLDEDAFLEDDLMEDAEDAEEDSPNQEVQEPEKEGLDAIFAEMDDDAASDPVFDDEDEISVPVLADSAQPDQISAEADIEDVTEAEDEVEENENVDPLAPPVVDSTGKPFDNSDSIDFEDISLEEMESDESEVPVVQVEDDFDENDEGVVKLERPEPLVEEAPAAPKKKIRGPYKIPSDLLDTYSNGEYWLIDEETKQAASDLKETLSEFKIEAEVTGIRKGPVVTMFEILPAPGVKLSKIVALQDNIALRLAASSVRIVAPIPGKHAVGIEVPNKERAVVSFKEIVDLDLPQFNKMAIPVILGKDISGEPQVLDLAKTPHLLIAGSTGAGKSVCVNSMILSILYKRSPQDVKLIMIDPKVVELKLYNDIPHLLTPVITESKRAFQSLQYCLCEMERRYACLDGMGVRDIVSYNKRIVERKIAAEKLPYIVVIIDEFADLMATTGKELESTIARLAAMSRAVGIHLVLATQRPSIDVITGLIKANIPSRIAFMVASKMDSRIIIDQVGAEKLLGKGDMLYASATDPFPVRIQGTLVNDNEVEAVVDYVKQYGEPEYIDDEIFVDDDEEGGSGPGLFSDGEDPLYDEALQIVVQAGKASASYIQRRLKIGYNRAARLVEEMEERGIVGPANGSKPREVIHVPS